MPRFRIVYESTRTVLLSKDFDAPTLEAAIELAEKEPCEGPEAGGWEEYNSYTCLEIREDQCGPANPQP